MPKNHCSYSRCFTRGGFKSLFKIFRNLKTEIEIAEKLAWPIFSSNSQNKSNGNSPRTSTTSDENKYISGDD